MPHVVVEFSDNLRERVDVPALLRAVHAAALATGVFPRGGTRTRAEPRGEYLIADGHPDNAFVHVTLRIGHGRDLPTRRRAGEQVFEVLRTELAAALEAGPLAISFEVQEIDPALSWKHNTVHDYVSARDAGRERP
ncbi:MAG: 5-carboxymethyl-2-hydroxymuconate Delta-isomerase [Burkholderiales bacterium]|nr:MAG: 5-carboxymethyl-2-hydroxymuconate Delta-isomerase [Burkholderiales bacterium]